MNRTLLLRLSLPLALLYLAANADGGSQQSVLPSREDRLRAEYFDSESAKLAEGCLAGIRTLDDWNSRKAELRRELLDMLGLWPMPERTDLKAVVTGTLDHPEFTVEKIHFQALPHLYVTANLYLPKGLEKPAPAILYACGHARVVTNGLSCGNKTGYQHHGAWFARNGYVALLIDTVQLGEIEGLHHGTYRENQWWWNSRGYTPAGVEAWFGIRALDYLCTRPEVDRERIGMTGRSGGGSYTWTVAALDDRVKVAAPVAGMTDLHNQVVDGVVEGHCDCMFYLNRYHWDFPQAAALIAPRPLLIANSDKDTIFPLDGVVRLHQQVRRIYELHGKADQLGLLITEGPHKDTQDLQVPVFRWFNRFLKGEQPLVEMAAKPFFTPLQLRVFDKLPEDQLNTRIQELFVAKAPAGSFTGSASDLERLRNTVFGGWPEIATPVAFTLSGQEDSGRVRERVFELPVQPGVALPCVIIEDRTVKRPERLVLVVTGLEGWTNSPLGDGLQARPLPELQQEMQSQKAVLAFFAPRDVAPTPWLRDPAKSTQLRRRYMLLGQTVDSMRVWDIRCAVQALKQMRQFKDIPLRIRAADDMAVNSAYAALFEPAINELELHRVPRSHLEGPDYLNVLRVCDIPEVMSALGSRIGRESRMIRE